MEHYLALVVDNAILGPRLMFENFYNHPDLLIRTGMVLAILLLAGAWLTRKTHLAAAVSLLVSGVFFVGVMTLTGTWDVWIPPWFWHGSFAQYWFFPAFLIGFAVLTMSDWLLTRQRFRTVAMILGSILITCQLAVVAWNINFFDARVEWQSAMPDWGDALKHGREQCTAADVENVVLYSISEGFPADPTDNAVWDVFWARCDKLR